MHQMKIEVSTVCNRTDILRSETVSLLFEELDCEKTCDKVDDFLTNDLDRLILMI